MYDLFFRYLTCTNCATDCEHYPLPNSRLTWSFKETGEGNSAELDDTASETSESPDVQLCVEEWICVIYDGVWYPGLITNIESDQITVKFLKRIKKSFEWPEPADVQSVTPNQILCKIDEPSKICCKNKKERYSLSRNQMQYVNEMFASCVIYN